MLYFDSKVIHVPGVTLGIVDYLSRYPTFSAPAPSIYDELFVVRSIQDFNSALTFINSFNVINSGDGLCSSSQEVVDPHTLNFSLSSSKFSPVGGVSKPIRPVNQSDHVMQIRA